ncbi:MAG: CHRD domain-containing protein [Longimicrobiales bacterium]|nr:CHRD domain-containing protein [Longimicrobiales bacterium]
MTTTSFRAACLATHSRTFLAVSALLVAGFLVGCGGEGAGGDGGDETITASSEFLGLGGSGVTGQVDFTRDGGIITVEVLAENIRDTGDHPSHIHEGTCREPGGVVVPLTPATVSEPGIVEAESQVELSDLPTGTSYVVMIHSQQGAPIGCAELPGELVER